MYAGMVGLPDISGLATFTATRIDDRINVHGDVHRDIIPYNRVNRRIEFSLELRRISDEKFKVKKAEVKEPIKLSGSWGDCYTQSVTPASPSLTVHDFYLGYFSDITKKRTTIECGEGDLAFVVYAEIYYLDHLKIFQCQAGPGLNLIRKIENFPTGGDGLQWLGMAVPYNPPNNTVDAFLQAAGVDCTVSSVKVCGYIHY